MNYKNIANIVFTLCVLLLICLGLAFSVLASQSANYQIWPVVVSASGTTLASTNYKVCNSTGQAASGRISSSVYSMQLGFLNEYSVAIPISTSTPVCTATATPTFTPTLFVTITPTSTQTTIVSAMPTATSTLTSTPTLQVTKSYTDFEGQIISKNYIYAAPNPVRGSTAKIYVVCKQRATGKIKIFTLLGQEVLSIERSFQVGDNLETIYVGNLANAMYYLFVRVRNDEGLEERAKTKFILLQ